MSALDASFVSPVEGKKCNVFADTVTIKVPSEMAKGAYSISEDVTPPGAGAPPHTHTREEETFYVLEGEFEFRCDDRILKATKGAIASLPRGIPHGFKNKGNTPGKALLVLVPGGMEKVFEDISAMPPGPPDIENRRHNHEIRG